MRETMCREQATATGERDSLAKQSTSPIITAKKRLEKVSKRVV